MVIFRVGGFEISILLGKYTPLVGYLFSDSGLAVGLGFARVMVRRGAAPPVKEATQLPSNKCPVCAEPVLESEPSEDFLAATVLARLGVDVPGFMKVRAHRECMVFVRHGRVGCQRKQCPNCEPPKGQSIRDQARDAEAFFKASNGRRATGKGAVS